MKIKPWYKIVTPREDLRHGKPLDASEFAVHLDQVRDGRAVPLFELGSALQQRGDVARARHIEVGDDVLRGDNALGLGLEAERSVLNVGFVLSHLERRQLLIG